jgi:hypothetical protein
MLTALHRGVPDRVPATVHQWQAFHLNTYLGGISDIEAFRRFGLDASLTRFPLKPCNDPRWVIETREVEAPPGERRFQVSVTTPGIDRTERLQRLRNVHSAIHARRRAPPRIEGTHWG